MVFKSKATLKNQVPPKTEESEPSASKPKKTGNKSPARSKSPARPKSPARTKSPARSRSPGRKNPLGAKTDASPPPLQSSTPKVAVPKARSPIGKSNSRKSPTRMAKIARSTETYFSEKISRPRRTWVDVETDLDSPDGEVIASEKPQTTVRGRPRRLEVKVEKLNMSASETIQPSTSNVSKRMTQNSQAREVERVVHLKHFDKVAQKLGEFSDEDDTVQLRKSVSVERSGEFKPITEFGGSWGALFYTIIIPIGIIGLLISCNERQCSFIQLPDCRKYLLLSAYIDLSSILGFTGYAIFLALLSVIPFGGKQVLGMATKQGKFTYIMNGLFSCVVLIAIAVGLEFRNIPITEFVVKHYFHLLIASFLFGLLLSTYVYIRSFYVPFSSLNAHVLGRSRIYGFFLGRELNPRAFGILDLKMYFIRLAVIGSLLLDFFFVYKSLSWTSSTVGPLDLNSLNINPTLILLTVIHSIYYLNALVSEPHWVTSFEIQYEGFGYMSGVGYLIYPFMMATVTKYVVDYNVQLCSWKLVLISLVFIFGYILYRGSNNQKSAFRKNPYDPALSHLEAIPTTKGKKLICSGFWGVVRHPNYLGDILMNLSFIPFAPDVPPVATAIAIALLLIHRSVRDNIRCKQKYGAAWDRYCNKVKYVLLPKVY